MNSLKPAALKKCVSAIADCTTISNEVLQSPLLSLEDKGILAVISDLAAKGACTAADLAAMCDDNSDLLRLTDGLARLEKAGYITSTEVSL